MENFGNLIIVLLAIYGLVNFIKYLMYKFGKANTPNIGGGGGGSNDGPPLQKK